MRKQIVFSMITMLAACGSALAAAEKEPFTLSPMRITQLKPTPFLYASVETSLNDLNTLIAPIMDNFVDAMSRGAFLPSGGPVFIYHGSTADRTKQFKLEIGYPAQDGVKPVEGFAVGKLASVPEATAVYVGPINDIGRAYRKLYPELIADGHIPSDVRRERYLYWESEDSPNNVIMIEIMLKN